MIRWVLETGRTLAVPFLVLFAVGLAVENIRDLMTLENLTGLRSVARFVFLP